MRTRGDADHSDRLDDKTRALVRLAALVATGAEGCSAREHVAAALTAGATDEEIVDVLLAVASTIGMARLVAAAPPLALGLGLDLDRAFERLDDEPRP